MAIFEFDKEEIVMLQLEEAIQKLCKYAADITDVEEIPVLDAIGRVLAEEWKAKKDQPPFPRSPLDGYALRSIDSRGAAKENPKCLQVIGKIYAGSEFGGRIGENEAVRIMTGAPIPEGSDAVIRQEDTDYGEEQVQIYKELSAYENYCPQGEDYKKGDILLQKGDMLDGISAGILASFGVSMVKVFRKVKISVVSTGDELVQPGENLGSGKIYDSNRYFISGRLAEMGIVPVVSCHCIDDAKKMVDEMKRLAPFSDLIITTGGVSVGQKDIMHEVIEKLSAKKLFWKVEMKPGAPVLAAVYDKALIICLSGNPFGAAANFELLVRPVIGKMARNSKWNMKKQNAVLQNDFLKKGKVRRFVRGYTEEGKVWVSDGNHASGALSSMLGCNCLIEISPDQPGARKGEQIWVHLL